MPHDGTWLGFVFCIPSQQNKLCTNSVLRHIKASQHFACFSTKSIQDARQISFTSYRYSHSMAFLPVPIPLL